MAKKTPISISAGADEVLLMDKYAKEHGLTRSDAVRILIKKGLDNEGHVQNIVRMSESFIGENSNLLYSVLAEIEKLADVQRSVIGQLEVIADTIVDIDEVSDDAKLKLYSGINGLQNLIKDTGHLSKKEEFFLKLYAGLKSPV